MATGAVGGDGGMSGLGDAPSLIRSRMPMLARNDGVWEGRYRFIRPDLTLIDAYDFRIAVSFPEDGEGGITYRQESAYHWDDGRAQSLMFEARLAGDRLVFDNGRIGGIMWEVDDATLYLRFRFSETPEVEVFEMIQLAPNNIDRARTWHWLRDGKLFQITLVDERRAS
jgi:hypothetical protein